jgi:hypothetical protein
MSRIAAFVGHSFSKSDEALVTRFLNFFDHVQDLGIGFTWDHAENAEPKVLSEKVKEKMEGKNLFIGLCTLKELAIAPEQLRTPFLRPASFVAERSNFEAKTSDWITQEIGYSIAKGMKLILLIEDGVRRPGGLQGDIEHIPFSRSNPPDSFEKILEMVRALGPKVAPLNQSTSQARAEPSKSEEEQAKDSLDGEPDSTWTRESYESAILGSVYGDNERRTAALLQSFADAEIGKDPEQRADLEAHSIWLARIFDKKGAKNTRLEELASTHPKNHTIKKYLAQSYESFGIHDKAAQQYLAAAELTTHVDDQLGYLKDAATSRARNGDVSADTWLREKYSALQGKTTLCAQVFRRGLLEIAKIHKADQLWIAYQEARLLDLPDNYDSRDDLAWMYFSKGNYGLALYHYLLIPHSERSKYVWNNIGAAYKELEVPTKAVQAYRQSEAIGGTYAVSNLAFLLIEAGFSKEAEDLCKAALRKDNCDKRVAAALSSIGEKSAAEEKKESKISKDSEEEHRFMANLGNAYCATESLPATTSWSTPDCTVSVTIDGDSFSALGTYEQPSAFSFASLVAGHQGGKATTMVVSYDGKMVGRGVSFSKSRYEQGSKPSILATNGESGLLIIDETLQNATVMVTSDKKSVTYQKWNRAG